MRKHFLILMLLTLLPLAGWAVDNLTFKLGTTAASSSVYTGNDYLALAENALEVYDGETKVTDATWTFSATDATVAAGDVVTKVDKAGYYKATKSAKSGVFQVTKADITTADFTAPTAVANLIYTAADQYLIVAGNTANVGTIKYNVSSGAFGDALPQGTIAGDYVVKYKIIGDANHNDFPETTVPNTTIAKEVLSIRALSPGITYGDAEPDISLFYQILGGAVNNEDEDDFGIPVEFETAIDMTNVGTKPFTLKAAAMTNYNVSFQTASGILSIGPKPITIGTTETSNTVVYGTAVAKTNFDIADYQDQLKQGDALTGNLDYEYTYSTTQAGEYAPAQTIANVGYYKVYAKGLSNPNYAVTFEPALFQVTKKPLAATMIADIDDVYYNGTNRKPIPEVTDAAGITEDDYEVKYYVDDTQITGNALNTAFVDANETDYKVEIVATNDGNFSGKASKLFKVKKLPIQLRTKGETVTYSAQVFNNGGANDYVLSNAAHLQWDVNTVATDLDNNMLTDEARGKDGGDPGATFALSLYKGNTVVNAGDILNAGTYTVKVDITDAAKIKNYTITVGNIGKLVVNKKEVTIKPKDKTVDYGVENEFQPAVVQTTDANLWIGTLNQAGTAIIDGTGFQGGDTYATVFNADENANKVSLVRDGDNTAGDKTITATIPANAEWDNYVFTISGTGKYTITAQGGVQIWAEDASSFYHATEAATPTAIIVGINPDEITETMQNAVNAALTVAWPEGKNASTANAGNYTINVNAAAVKTALASLGNYNLDDMEVYSGTYTVKRAALQVTVKPQTHIVGETVTGAKAATVTINTTGLTDDDKTALFDATHGIKLAFANVNEGCQVPTEQVGDDIVLKATAASTGWTGTAAASEDKDKGVWVDGIVVDATAYNAFASNNFTLDATKAQGALATPGILYVTVANDPVVFDIMATSTTQISDVAGKKVDATISDDAIRPRKLYANEWNAIVLPFDITPYEFTSAIETYAVFDILQESGTAMNFKITINEIPAYTPFLVKVSETVDLSEKSFDGVVIKTVEEAAKANDAYIFQGNLTMSTPVPAWLFTADSEHSEKVEYGSIDLFHNVEGATGKDAPRPCPAFGAYIKAKPTTPATEAPQIFIEEADGSVTAISAINAEGVAVKAEGWYTINGMKLNAAPTEKGVYINNGKKVVVK